MVREERLSAERHGRRLYSHAGDLPTKPPTVDGPQLVGYDPVADARKSRPDARVRGEAFLRAILEGEKPAPQQPLTLETLWARYPLCQC
jgi:hypothetical protein